MKYIKQLLIIIVFSLAGEALAALIPLPVPAKIFDSYNCECCGEKTGANWIRIAGGRKLCLDCYESYNRFDV